MKLYDYDNMTRLPLEVINYISVYEISAWVRVSSSTKGLHLKVDTTHDLHTIKKYSDPHYEMKKELLGYSLLWDDGCSPWYKIENFGVYEK